MTTKEYLQQIGKLNKMINNKMIELAQMKEMAYSIKAVGTDERVMSSSDPDKTGCAYAKIEEMEEKINGMIDNYVDTKEKIINQIVHTGQTFCMNPLCPVMQLKHTYFFCPLR